MTHSSVSWRTGPISSGTRRKAQVRTSPLQLPAEGFHQCSRHERKAVPGCGVNRVAQSESGHEYLIDHRFLLQDRPRGAGRSDQSATQSHPNSKSKRKLNTAFAQSGDGRTE